MIDYRPCARSHSREAAQRYDRCMDEKDFKKHLKDLAHGHHHPEEHDWATGAAPAKTKAKAKAVAKKPAKKAPAKKKSK